MKRLLIAILVALLPITAAYSFPPTEIANNAETLAGTDTSKAVTPAGLSSRLAAPGPIGGTTPGAGNFSSVGVGATGTLTEETNTLTFDDGDGAPITLQTIRDKEPPQTPVSQAEAEAGTEATIRSWSPVRVLQAFTAYLLDGLPAIFSNVTIGTTYRGATRAGIDAAITAGAKSIELTGDITLAAHWDLSAFTGRFSTNGHQISGAFTFTAPPDFVGSDNCFGSTLTVTGLKYAEPEWFGAGFGGADDTAALVQWVGSSHQLRATGSYTVANNTSLSKTITSDFYMDLSGSTFTVGIARSNLFSIVCNTDGLSIEAKGGTVAGASLLSRGVVLSGTKTAKKVDIGGFAVNNLKEITSALSPAAIHVALQSELINIHDNIINTVERTTIDPGVVASRGILVSDIVGDVNIYNNVVKSILRPGVDGDADAIVVSSKDGATTPAVAHNFKINIFNNHVVDSMGRFIKSLSPNTYVYNNLFESLSGALATTFVGIDFQYGGSHALNNTWNFSSGITGAGSAVFVYMQNGIGPIEHTCSVKGNIVYMGTMLPYGLNIRQLAGTMDIEYSDNRFVSNDGTIRVDALSQINIPTIANITYCKLRILRNIYNQTLSGSLIKFYNAEWATDATYATKFELSIIDNIVTNATSSSLLFASTGTRNPHISNMVIRGNTGFVGNPYVETQSTDVQTLPTGNNFYYTTDGGATGLLNCPTGFNRYVQVVRNDRGIELTSLDGSKTARSNTGGTTWYYYGRHKSGTDDPSSTSEAVEFIGQIYIKTDTQKVYVAYGLTAGNWVLTN